MHPAKLRGANYLNSSILIFEFFHGGGDLGLSLDHHVLPFTHVIVGDIALAHAFYIAFKHAKILLVAVEAVGAVGIAAHGHAKLIGDALLQHYQCKGVDFRFLGFSAFSFGKKRVD